jgi:hypothetical protein
MKKEIIEQFIKEIPYKKSTELIEIYFSYSTIRENLNKYEKMYLKAIEKELLKRNEVE